jgi:hypothetical protein
MSMTFNDNESERRERGQVKLRRHETGALSYSECLYEVIRVLSLINNGGTSFIL